jgi:hypothetical protein
MLIIPVPKEFKLMGPLRTIHNFVKDEDYRKWVRFIENIYVKYIFEAIERALLEGLIEPKMIESPDFPQIKGAIENYPFPDAIAAFDEIHSKFYISLEETFKYFAKVYLALKKVGKFSERKFERTILPVLRLTAYHETGHMILRLHLGRPTTNLAESIFSEAFAEYFAWWLAYARKDKLLIKHVEEKEVKKAKKLFRKTTDHRKLSHDELLMIKLMNFYLGDPWNELAFLEKKLQETMLVFQQISKLLSTYHRDPSPVDERYLSELKILLRKYTRMLKALNKAFGPALGFLMLEGKQETIKKRLIPASYRTSKALEKLKSLVKFDYLAAAKALPELAAVLVAYREVLDKLRRLTELYGYYKLGPRELAKLLYKHLAKYPYGSNSEFSLHGCCKITIELPDVSHAVGLRLTYEIYREGISPQVLITMLDMNKKLALKWGYKAFRQWIQFLYEKWFNKK